MRVAVPQVAVLFARADSVYKSIRCADVYDEARDARKYPGGLPVVAHPPCRAWGCLRAFAKPKPHEKELARFAVRQIRRYGGVLEHPEKSTLWPDQGLPKPGLHNDDYGGWTLQVDQFHFGHKAQKRSWFYIVGCSYSRLPPIPFREGKATHFVTQPPVTKMRGRRRVKGDPDWKPELLKWEREVTPTALALWLVETAKLCHR